MLPALSIILGAQASGLSIAELIKKASQEMSSSPRIPYPEHADVPPGALNIERMFFHMPPDLLAGFGAFAQAVMTTKALDPLLRELAILRVGHLSNAPYEIHQHSAFAHHLGMEEAKIAAIASGAAASVFDAREQALLSFVDDLVLRVRPSDASLATIRQHLDIPALFALVLVAGQYMLVCRILETTAVPIEEEPGIGVVRLSTTQQS